MIKICVLVSGGGTNLQALIDAQPYEGGILSLVISSNPEAYALQRAKGAGIPAMVIQPGEFKTREEFTDALQAALQDNEIGLVALAGFMVILSPHFSYPAINIHPALIPAFCGKGFYGLRVHRAALDYGVKVTGATVHYVTDVPDGGPIINQKAIPVLSGDTPESLQRRVMEEGEWPLLTEAVRGHCRGEYKMVLLKTVPGLSVDKALRHYGGSASKYENVLCRTARRLPEHINRLESLVQGGAEAYAQEVHGIKGVLSNIGAYSLEETASQLEDCARTKNTSACETLQKTFSRALRDMLKKVTCVLQPVKVQTGEDTDRLLALLPELEHFTDMFDSASALRLLSPVRAYAHSPEWDGFAEVITKAFEECDFEKAKREIIRMKEFDLNE